MKKLTTTLAGATLATATLFGTAAPANAADTKTCRTQSTTSWFRKTGVS